MVSLALATTPTLAANRAHLLKDVRPGSGSSYPGNWLKLGNRAVFTAGDASHGFEPWISDGTRAGTHLIKDIRTGAASSSDNTYIVHLTSSKLIFNATTAAGDGIWTTDGTAGGTKLARIINPTRGAGNFWQADKALHGAWLFFADDGVHGWELWRSDGTFTGTYIVKQVAPGSAGVLRVGGLNVVGGLAYALMDDGVHGMELWRSDGTASGTFRLTDVNAGAGDSSPDVLGTLGANLFFSAIDASNRTSLWMTDGTKTGTHVLKPSPTGPGTGGPFGWQVFNGKAYFAWSDGLDNGTTHGDELWITDGTTGGTHLFKDLRPGGNSDPQYFITVGNVFYFGARGNNTNSWDLWVSNGTNAGTTLVKTISPTGGSGFAFGGCRFVHVNDKVFFVADDSTHGSEMWVSDGTDPGTHMVKNINTSGSADPAVRSWRAARSTSRQRRARAATSST